MLRGGKETKPTPKPTEAKPADCTKPPMEKIRRIKGQWRKARGHTRSNDDSDDEEETTNKSERVDPIKTETRTSSPISSTFSTTRRPPRRAIPSKTAGSGDRAQGPRLGRPLKSLENP